MNIFKKFDVWVNQGPFTALDLGIYRVIYALCAILVSRDVTWLADYPDSIYYPPPGPFALLSGFPSHSALVAMEVALFASLVLLGLGLFTKPMSFLTALLLLLNFGFTYNVGKIDHTFLTVLAPLVLAFANWGHRFSLDSLLRKKPDRGLVQWPIRYMAFAVALAFFTAAGFKAGTGWLEFSTQATRGYFYNIYFLAPHGWLTGAGDWVRNKALWEAVDWFTVLIEFAFIATLPWWRAFRITCAFATQFHVGVFLLLGIVHVTEVIVYGAFVSWGFLFARGRWSRAFQKPVVVVLAVSLFIAVAGVKLWLVLTQTDWAGTWAWSDMYAGAAIVLIGGAIGFLYLIRQGVELSRRLRSRRFVTSTS